MDNLWITLETLIAFAAGLAGAAVRLWALARRIAELEYRQADQEARILRETKMRASMEAKEAKNAQRRFEEAVLEAAGGPEAQPVRPALSFVEWYRAKMKGRP